MAQGKRTQETTVGTLQTIAQKLELSPSTVSRALRNINGVNLKTRQRVLEAAKNLNYSKHSLQTTGIALLLPGASITDVHEIAHRYMLTVSDAVAQRGWSMFPVIVNSLKRDSLKSINSWPDALKAPHLSGCIIVDAIGLDARLAICKHFKGRVVMLSRHDVEHGISGIRSLDYDGGKLAASKVLDAGHRRIGWIGSIGSDDISRERRSGVVAHLAANDMELAVEVWFDERRPLNARDIAAGMEKHLGPDRSTWPTAWISSNDFLGAQTIVYLKSLGLALPRDVVLVAFDDTKIAEIIAGCVISSVVMPFEKMGYGGVELLETLISQREPTPVIWSYPFTFRQGQTL